MNHPVQKEKWCIHKKMNRNKQIKYSKYNIIIDNDGWNINKFQKNEHSYH